MHLNGYREVLNATKGNRVKIGLYKNQFPVVNFVKTYDLLFLSHSG